MSRTELPIMDPAFKADPVPFYESVRARAGPVAPVRLPSGTEAWLITGYEAAREALRDRRLVKQHPDRGGEGAPPFGNPIFRHLLMRDPPDHTRLRALVSPCFTTVRVANLAAPITAIVDRLLDEIAPAGAADLIASLATPLPLRVIFTLLDIPADEEPVVRRWMERLNEADLRTPEDTPAIAAALHRWILGVISRPHAGDPDSVMGRLHRARESGALSTDDLCAMIFLLLGAGYETTVSLIGNGVAAMLRDRSQWSRLCADERLAPAAVEEVLRFESPLEVATPRYAAVDMTIGAATIGRGDMVLVGLAAANRDPAWLPDGREFRIDRSPAPAHLSFGHGIHYCLGSSLARLEGAIAFARLSSRFPDLQPSVAPERWRWRPGLIMRGLESLPVRFAARHGPDAQAASHPGPPPPRPPTPA